MVNQNIKAVIGSLSGTPYEYGAGGECEGWILHNLDPSETLTFNVGGQDVKVGPKTWKRVDCVDDSVTVSGTVGEFNIIALENGDAEIERMASGSSSGGGGVTVTGIDTPDPGSSSSRNPFQGHHIIISKTPGSFSSVRYFELPAAPVNWLAYIVKDGQGDASANNIDIAPNSGQTIDGGTASAVISSNYGSLSFVFDGIDNWSIV